LMAFYDFYCMLGMFRFTFFIFNFMFSYPNFISLLQISSRLTKNTAGLSYKKCAIFPKVGRRLGLIL
jgi:hypothetical protein